MLCACVGGKALSRFRYTLGGGALVEECRGVPRILSDDIARNAAWGGGSWIGSFCSVGVVKL